jgi:hypothetical protein
MRTVLPLLGLASLLALATVLPACGGGSGPVETPTPPADLVITTTTLPNATVGQAYSQTINATGGVPPYSFIVSVGSAPAGLDLSTGGALSGTPTTSGPVDFTVRVSDSQSPTPDNDTQAFTLQVDAGMSGGGSYAWTLLTPTGTAPGGRTSFGAASDPAGGPLLVTLGSVGDSMTNPPVYSDSFSLDLTSGSEAWTTLGTGPVGRWGNSLVVDTTNSRALLFAGNQNGFTNSNDTWALASGAWTQLMPGGTAPGVRLEQAAVYDPVNQRMIVFGGGTGFDPVGAPLNDTWALDVSAGNGNGANGTWAQLSPTGTAPGARAAMVAVYDPDRQTMIVFGGGTTQPTNAYNDVWSLDLSTAQGAWSQITPSGTPPAARRYAGGMYDPTNKQLLVFGGEDGSQDYNDVWALSLDPTPGSEAWTQITPTGTPPAARDSHCAVYDAANKRMIVYGGFTMFPSTPFTDIWALSLPTP